MAHLLELAQLGGKHLAGSIQHVPAATVIGLHVKLVYATDTGIGLSGLNRHAGSVEGLGTGLAFDGGRFCHQSHIRHQRLFELDDHELGLGGTDETVRGVIGVQMVQIGPAGRRHRQETAA